MPAIVRCVLEKDPKPWEKTATLLRQKSRDKTLRGIGLEIERIGLWSDGYALHYRAGGPDGKRPGAEHLLNTLARDLGWEIVTYSEKYPLGLQGPDGKVSLEPGSQLEFSAAPAHSVDAARALVEGFEKDVDRLTSPWGVHWIGLGINPTTAVDQMDVIPLTRYQLMTEYLHRRGTLATRMMRLSSSIQINFDYSDEAEAIEMLRVGLAAAPLSYALFGNSPFHERKPTGWLSYRSEIWRHMDPDRSGLMPEAFEEGFSFSRYTELAWKRPLMFAQNKSGQNVETLGRSLEDISLGLLKDVSVNEENELNTLRQIFTEARLKPGYVEIRSIDGLRPAERYAAIAFWTGLIYEEDARLLALDRLGGLTPKLRDELWIVAGREGLRGKVGGICLGEMATELIAASRRGLLKRGFGEEKWLTRLERSVAEGKNPADRVLELFHGPWKENFSEVIAYSASRST